LHGFISWWPPESFTHNLFVSSNCLRQGIGTALLRECLAIIGSPARQKCGKTNQQFAFTRGMAHKLKLRESALTEITYLMVFYQPQETGAVDTRNSAANESP
jgi:hypothetical protein